MTTPKTTIMMMNNRTMAPVAAARRAGRCALTLLLAASAAAQAADVPVSSPTAPPRQAAPTAARPAPAQRLQAICSAADLNHDGSVSLDEFHHDIVQGWHSLSPDVTGHVALADVSQVPRVGKAQLRRLATTDRDSDGRLSFKEVVEARMAYFSTADTNRDDVLSLQECMAYERQRRSQRR